MGFTTLIQYLTNVLSNIGIIGLPLVMLIEGASIPFPGIIIVLSYGYILNLSILGVFLTAAMMAVAYTIASFAPYLVAMKIEKKLPQKLKTGIEKAQRLFHQYGSYSIAFTRPFGIGNYISYVAGICKVKPLQYAILTFLGIYPWSLATLFLGKYYKGNLEYIKQAFAIGFIHQYLIGIISLIFLTIFLAIFIRKKIKKEKRKGKMVIMANRENIVEKSN